MSGMQFPIILSFIFAHVFIELTHCGPTYAIWHQWTDSLLVKVMACDLSVLHQVITLINTDWLATKHPGANLSEI